MLELLVVIVMSLTLGSIAVLGYRAVVNYLRVAGDIRDLNGLVGQAKMRAGADFTHARVYADLTANTFHLETWNKTKLCWVTVGDPLALTANPCTVVGTSPVQSLAQGDTFGVGAIGAAPANTQTVFGQAPACDDGQGGTIANTACIVFNSRGLSVPIVAGSKSNTGPPTPNGAFYVTNGTVVNAVTVSLAGSVQVWSTPAGATGWHMQ